MPTSKRKFGHFLSNLALQGVLTLPRLLPYRPRIAFAGWMVSRLVAPLAKYDKRIRANLNYVLPELPETTVDELCRTVPENAGRTLMEVYSGDAFVERIREVPITGPGLAELDAAHAAGRPIIVVSGHFGNYDAPRAALRLRGHQIGALYRPFSNPYFDAHYLKAIQKVASPIFPQSRRGLSEMIRFLKAGNTVAILMDLHSTSGSLLSFFGKPAPSSLSAAELALKYDALLVPVYGTRQENGFDFSIEVEAPIPHTDAETMTQLIADSLEARVRNDMAQWLWIHRRWKPERTQRMREAANIEP
ncbi:lysophospholipid acyltransferase family protein [Cochlodiniinecator piscidefendens]|uniref:lysophospholipid acyltransferase family protein n=1 Tax=Cochlodiniinecator piscidefendens TaxID=2715756 RepID=UPI002F3F154F